MIERLGSAIVVSGPSGVGKSTLIRLVREALPELEFSVSCTTRAPREGEEDHIHYHFISEAEFDRRLAEDAFLEHADIFTRRYGTLRAELVERIGRGADVILDIDVQGAAQIAAHCRRDPWLARVVEKVFVVPPSRAELESRLRGRATESEEQIRLRLDQAGRETAHWEEYDYIVVNHCSQTAAAELVALFKSFRLKRSRITRENFSK